MKSQLVVLQVFIELVLYITCLPSLQTYTSIPREANAATSEIPGLSSTGVKWPSGIIGMQEKSKYAYTTKDHKIFDKEPHRHRHRKLLRGGEDSMATQDTPQVQDSLPTNTLNHSQGTKEFLGTPSPAPQIFPIIDRQKEVKRESATLDIIKILCVMYLLWYFMLHRREEG